MKMIEKIVQLLADRGQTQAGLEKQVGLSENRISKWKDGTGEPTARQALAMARALGVPLEYLIDDDLDDVPAASPAIPPDEQTVLSHYRVRRSIEGESFTPDELGRRIAAPRDQPAYISGSPSLLGSAGSLNPRKASAGAEP